MKNDALQAIVDQLNAEIPAVNWTRRALFREQVQVAGGPWPTGCVVAVAWHAEGEPGAPRIWHGDIVILVHARQLENANVEMVELLDQLEASLSETSSEVFARLQIVSAQIDQDDDQDGSCGLQVRLSLTL